MDVATLKAKLGDLWEPSTSGSVKDIQSMIDRQLSTNSSYRPPFQDIMCAATMKDRVDIVKYCLQQGATADRNVMSFLISSDSINTHKALVEAKAIPIDHYIPWFGTVLSVAATDGHFEWVKFCLESGADPNKDKVDEHLSVLASAAENGHIDVMELLLAHGAVLHGSGAIVQAAEAGEREAVAFLLDKGADINEIGVEHPLDMRVTAKMGTALHKAVRAGHMDIMQMLLEGGAEINLPDVQGRTPLALAKLEGRTEMMELLESRGGK